IVHRAQVRRPKVALVLVAAGLVVLVAATVGFFREFGRNSVAEIGTANGSSLTAPSIKEKNLEPSAPASRPLCNAKDPTGWNVPALSGESLAIDSEHGWIIDQLTQSVGRKEEKQRDIWLGTATQYADFHLKLEFSRTSATSRGGVGFRAVSGAGFNLLAVIIHDSLPPNKRRTGYLAYAGIDALEPHTAAKLKSLGTGNKMEIEVHGPSVRVAINGEEVGEYEIDPAIAGDGESLAKANLRRAKGHVGLASAGVRFRNIQI